MAATDYIGQRFNYLKPVRVVVVLSARSDAGALLECLCLRCKINTRPVLTKHLRKQHGPRMCRECARERQREGQAKGGKLGMEKRWSSTLRELLSSFTPEEEELYRRYLGARTSRSDRLEAARMVRQFKGWGFKAA